MFLDYTYYKNEENVKKKKISTIQWQEPKESVSLS